MALFGRRKPGFSKEVKLNPDEIPGEFSDALDPAVNRELDNPKAEKRILQENAEKVINGEKSVPDGDKQDILDYLESLPDVEDPFPPSEPEEEAPVEETPKRPGQILADYIRKRSAAAALTSQKSLMEEADDMEELIAAMNEDEDCKDIRHVDGQKDIYYYSEENMANNYAMIAALVEEKDACRTIAHMVRFNCKTYPTPTPTSYFEHHPYYMTRVQVKQAIEMMKRNPDYADIQLLETERGKVPYLFAEGVMSRRYAQALADAAETDEADR